MPIITLFYTYTQTYTQTSFYDAYIILFCLPSPLYDVLSTVKRSQTTVMTSKTGHDAGCTYVNIFCVGCDETIGKYYITTSRVVDRLRDKFSLFIDKVSVYQVGSANMGSYPEPEVLLQHEKPDTAQEDMLKIKEVLLSLHDKITSLESRLMSLEAHVFPAHGGGGNSSGHLTNYSLVREQSVSSTYRYCGTYSAPYMHTPAARSYKLFCVNLLSYVLMYINLNTCIPPQ